MQCQECNPVMHSRLWPADAMFLARSVSIDTSDVVCDHPMTSFLIFRWEAREGICIVAAHTQDLPQSDGPGPTASQALCEPGTLRRNAGRGRQDDGWLPWPPGHWAVHPGRDECCKFHMQLNHNRGSIHYLKSYKIYLNYTTEIIKSFSQFKYVQLIF